MSDTAQAQKHDRSIYALLIVIALSITAGRIAVVTSREGTTAFLSANDRSRWATIACLVERGTYAIDEQIAITDPIKRNRRPWNSIDKVRHIGRDGKQHYYSSKPPLLPTMIAGVYWTVRSITGMTLTDQPIYLARIILGLVNLPLLGIFLVATILSIDQVAKNDWTRRVGAACCCFGTMLMPFSISLNNHLPAATATAVAMWIYLMMSERKRRSSKDESARSDSFLWYFLAGIAAAMAAANELPALSMMVFWIALFGWLSRKSILPMGLGVLVVAAGFFGTNWWAHESLKPAYAHRGNGDKIEQYAGSSDLTEPDANVIESISETLKSEQLMEADESIKIDDSDEEDRWVARVGERQFAVLKATESWQLAHWDDWYEYSDSYWRPENLRGVDRGESSRAVYLLHMTVGHYGLFSLTPIWLLVPVGLGIGLSVGGWDQRRMVAAILVATLVCSLFYLARPEIDRNYGGVSVCFRWLLWFAPLWLFVSSFALNGCSTSKFCRGLTLVLLAMSVFSMSTALSSPWQSPWLYRFWLFLGWIEG
ncbi:MAG: hypothetical protein AAGG48_19080 [Planctomycetota bacterium]